MKALTTDQMIERLLAEWQGRHVGTASSVRENPLRPLARLVTPGKGASLVDAARLLVTHARMAGVDDVDVIRALDAPLWWSHDEPSWVSVDYREIDDVQLEFACGMGVNRVTLVRHGARVNLNYATGFDAVLAYFRGEIAL